MTADEIAHEIQHLLNCNQGAARILQAIGYTGREEALRGRLYNNGHRQLAHRLFEMLAEVREAA